MLCESLYGGNVGAGVDDASYVKDTFGIGYMYPVVFDGTD